MLRKLTLQKLIVGIMVLLSANSYADNAIPLIKSLAPTEKSSSPETTPPGMDKEALFNMLAAEFSIYRNQYDKALDYYLSENKNLNSVYVAERATQLAMHQKRYMEMLEAAAIWQKLSPEDPQPPFFLSLGYSLTMQPNLAMEYMRRVLSLDGETDFTRLVNALPQGHPSESFFINELYQAAESHPDSYDLPLALALLYSRLGQPQLSLSYVDMAVQNAVNNHAAINMSVKLYLKYNQPEKALDVYRRALDYAPDDHELRRIFAQLAMQYNIDESRQQFEILLQEDSHDDHILLSLGLIYLEQEKLESAEGIFQQLVALKTRTSIANYYLSQIYYYQGKNSEALAAFAAITDQEETQRASELATRIYLDQQKIKEASELVDQALLKPIDTAQKERLQILKSMVLQQQGNSKSAYQLLSSLLDQNPDSVELRYSRAMLAETENSLSQMESDLRHIISIRPDNALALNALGYTLANKTDRYREAYQLIQQAHKLLPEDPAVLDSLGWVLYRMGKYKEAIGYLQHAMILFPDAEIAAHLGEVLWVSGQEPDAKKVFQDALETSPNHSAITETMKRLNVAL